jgi:hypothetical protein
MIQHRLWLLLLPYVGRVAASAIAMSGSAFTVSGGQAFRWTEFGYEPPQRIPRADGLLTPPSTLMTLRAGYRPVLHPTLETSRPGQHHHERLFDAIEPSDSGQAVIRRVLCRE